MDDQNKVKVSNENLAPMLNTETATTLHVTVRHSPDIDHGYAWFILVASFCVNMCHGSSFAFFSVLYDDLQQHFGGDYSSVAWIGSLQLGFSYGSVFLSGILVHHYGSRCVAVIGAIVTSGGIIVSSFSYNLTMLCLTYGVIGGIGLGFVQLPANVIVQQYFKKHRALAGGICLCGFGLSLFIVGPITRLGLDYFNWRGTVLLQGGAMLNLIPLAMIFVDLPDTNVEKSITDSEIQDDVKNEERMQKTWKSVLNNIYDWSLFKELNIWLLGFGLFCTFFGGVSFYQHFVARAIFEGVEQFHASLLVTILGICSTTSRFLFSVVANLPRVNRTLQFALGSFLGGLVAILSFPVETFLDFCLLAAAYGSTVGLYACLFSTLIVDLFGLKRLPHVMGLMSIFIGTACLLTGPFSGYVVDKTHKYDVPFYVTGSVQITGSLLITMIALRQKWLTNNQQIPEETSHC